MAHRMSIRRARPAHLFSFALVLLALIGYGSVAPAATSAPAGPPAPTAGALAPFLYVVPERDGRSVLVYASGDAGLSDGTLWTNLDIGPGANKGSYTMSLSTAQQAYLVAAPNFTPGLSQNATLNLTTTTGLDTGLVTFRREHVPALAQTAIPSEDGLFTLDLINAGTFISDTYIVVVPSFAPPAVPPPGHRILGSVYTIRAPDDVVQSDKPMLVEMRYDPASLAGADPHSLGIFAWSAQNGQWERQAGQLSTSSQTLTVATTRFRSFALMITPTWHDDFDEGSGLDLAQSLNVKRTLGSVKLSATPGSGVARSQPIAPPAGFRGWGTLVYSATTPATTTLTVDVLGPDDAVVVAAAPSGASLAALDPQQYPSLTLRANLASSEAGQTPSLDAWELSWVAAEFRSYLALVAR